MTLVSLGPQTGGLWEHLTTVVILSGLLHILKTERASLVAQ